MNQLVTDTLSSYKTPALTCLQQGQLEEFDALGGDTACHIRAFYILVLYNNIKTNPLEMLPESDMRFLICSYILTKTKVTEYDKLGVVTKETTDHTKLFPNLAKKKGCDLIRQLQITLADLSVDVMKKQALKHEDKELQKALNYVLADTLKRKTSSCFAQIKLILNTLIKQDQLLAIDVSRMCSECSQFHKQVLFYKSSGKNAFEHYQPQPEDDNKPVLVICGYSDQQVSCTDFKEYCRQLTDPQDQDTHILDALLACSAEHPQFAGNVKNEVLPDTLDIPNLKAEMENYKKIAEKKGCCLTNKKLFCIDHICCSLLNKLLDTNKVSAGTVT
jgi:hypothetical protein